MEYNFDILTQRRGTSSLKWDVKENELPMWVADMDFITVPQITEALQKRASSGIYGYSIIPDAWTQAYQTWWNKRHGLKIKKESLIFCTGVVPAISSAVRKLTTPAENIVILTPVYNIFFNSIRNNGRNIIQCPLIYNSNTDISKEAYTIDFKNLEKVLSDNQTTMLILCNPHNPVGRIWEKGELEKIGALCSKYNVIVISDEIHCDLTDPNAEYVPFASVNETCKNISITCLAPTKTFNIAGLQTAAVMAENPVLRHKIWRALNTDEVVEPNVFAIDATGSMKNDLDKLKTDMQPLLAELFEYLITTDNEEEMLL